MIRKIVRTSAGLAAAAALWAGLGAAPAQAEKIVVGMATASMTSSWIYVADAMGFWKDQGLDIEETILGGPGNLQALVAGDDQFGSLIGTAILNAVGHGQPLIGIASIQGTLMDELTLSNEAVAKTGLTVANSTEQQRAKALKGMTIAIDGPNTINDAFLTYVLQTGGLDPQKDITRTPVQSPALNSVMAAKRIDGFAITPPWTTIAQQKGTGVIWISGIRGDIPALAPFAFTTVATRADYCQKNPDICTKFVTGVRRAVAFMVSDPEKSEQIVATKLTDMDRGLIHADFTTQRELLVKDSKFTDAAWAVAQKFDVQTGLIKPEQQVSGFEGKLYTNAYVK